LVPVGTTGESPTLSHAEHKRVVELCIEAAAGRVPVIAGAGSNSTAEAVDFTKHAKEAGADAVLVVSPYYNKPSQEGLYQHFKAVAEAADIPVIVYNIPGRSVVDISVDTMARMAKVPNIIGVKDATADLARPLETRLTAGKDFCQLSGEDATVAAFLAQGGVGCISVTSNVAPKMCSELHAAWQERDLDTFDQLRDRLMPLHDAMFCEPSPAGAKYGASLLGKCSPNVRAPMTPLSEAGQAQVRDAMVHCGLIN
ncbi:MAG: 4-hydroxy-tetrahydrodipicolinate synthase, partial [Alphaproteobacteria bacterium]|nr:4-hydroxy-tetrahydrodipicolinate synthase [Alphaproteobacteria bacterium]